MMHGRWIAAADLVSGEVNEIKRYDDIGLHYMQVAYEILNANMPTAQFGDRCQDTSPTGHRQRPGPTITSSVLSRLQLGCSLSPIEVYLS